MLDHFSISHNSGVILWSRSFTPNFATLVSTASSPLNALIRESFIEGKATDNFERDGYNIRWTMENSLGLVFVVVFPALLPLTYIPALLSRVKQLFVSLFQTYISSFISALSDGSSYDSLRALKEKITEERWDGIFDRCLRDCESAGAKRERDTRASGASSPVSEDNVSADEIAKNVAALKNRMKRGRKGSPLATPVASPAKNASKLMRKWDNSPVTKEDMAALDYSKEEAPAEVDVSTLVSNDAMGMRNKAGLYEVAEWDARLPSEDEILARRTADLTIEDSGWSSVFSRLRSKNLTKEDLEPALAAMEKNLLDKNVAKDIAEKLCESVGTALVGKRLGTFTSVKSEVESAFSGAITRILTPKTSTDILVEIKRKEGPYSLTFVGVNGVGKSTNLSKVCFWLLQNGLRVLIAACDTFRSGAVEQLRVHFRNLGALGLQDKVELYERGYGKDAAGIAKDAIAYAATNGFDVVLIDTAGRMQDNEPLMRALAKLVTVNNPDKLVFVGEALVGNEAVDQLTKFDRALKDFGALNGQRRRGIDGIILTKFDTIDDKVGAALSMTYATGQPILFVGCGQTYTDLRHLRVNHIVSALLA